METYEIAGKAYPLAFTLGAMEQVDGLCGGVENIATAFDGKPMKEQIELLVEILHALLRGGRDHCLAGGEDAAEPPAKDLLRAALFPRDILPVKTAIYAAMTEGMSRTVEVEAPAPKNAGTTRDG